MCLRRHTAKSLRFLLSKIRRSRKGMVIKMYMVWLAAVATALFFGFCAGRVTLGETAAEKAEEVKEQSVFDKGRNRRGIVRGDARPAAGAVGSPVSGEVEDVQDGASPGVVIRPGEDKIYAPVSGKIIKVFPLGNAFLFRTESGAELHIRVGESGDELLGGYYRPRVLQNEIVSKGKLLLEFDRRGLEAEGISPRVSVTVETGGCGSEMTAAAGERVRTGEEILRIRRPGLAVSL